MPVVEERRAEEEEDGGQRGHVGSSLFNKWKMPRLRSCLILYVDINSS